MEGKATFILTDKYTKKPVKEITEHNLVTKALEKVIFPPPIARITMGSSNFSDIYFPACNKLLGGIVLLGNTLPEDENKFMLPPDVIPVGAAGKEYTGTNPYRGTFNISMSGPIENGYRLVWDFAPEKANGVIKCVGLTNYCFGNAAFLRSTEFDCCVSTCPVNMGQNLPAPLLTSIIGRYYGQSEGTRFYSLEYTPNTYKLTLYESEISDPRSIRVGDSVNDFKTAKIVSQKELEVPAMLLSGTSYSYCREDGCLYLLSYNYRYVSPNYNYTFSLMKVDAKTGTFLGMSNFNFTHDVGFGGFTSAVKDGKLFLAGSGIYATLFVIDIASGSIISQRYLTSSASYTMYELDGYIIGLEGTSSHYYKNYMEYADYPILHGSPTPETASDLVPAPYVLRQYYDNTRTNFYLMLRTDYLATINNLSTPIEKTDRHALQIRYELTY